MVPGQAGCEAIPHAVIASPLEGRLPMWLAAQPGDCEAAADQLVGRARTQGTWGLTSASWRVELVPRVSGCRVLGVLGLVPACWCVWLHLVPSGGQGHVQVRLWAQPVCW